MDTIVVLKNGEISEMGTFRELLSHNAAFAEFILTYLNDPDEDDDLDPFCKCVLVYRKYMHRKVGSYPAETIMFLKHQNVVSSNFMNLLMVSPLKLICFQKIAICF